MRDNKYESLELSEHFERVESETKLFLQNEETEHSNHCVIKVDQYAEILNKTSKSSPGPDKISYNILMKRLPKYLKEEICLLITSSINNSYNPIPWKESKVKTLLKPNKNKKEAENYRPISLTNFIAKKCETVEKNIVLRQCENNGVSGEVQRACRRNR